MPTQNLITAAGSLNGAPLYHFTSFDIERFSQVISEGEIYFSRATDFNDPFELTPIVDLEKTFADVDGRREIVDEYAEAIRKYEGDASVIRHAAELDEARANPDACRRLVGDTGFSYALTVQTNYRVYCLSTQLHAVLMWSHYAAKHQGIAFEYASTGEFFGNACKVHYRDIPEPVDPRLADPEVIYASAFLTKASSWRHEDEYRVIGSDDGHGGFVATTRGFARFPPDELTAVYVGCRMPPACIRAVVGEIRGRRRPVPVRRMVKVPQALTLEWREVP